MSKRQNQLETYLLQILSIPKAAHCDSFVAFLESSPSFAELRLNLTSQVITSARYACSIATLTPTQMKCLELKVKETQEGTVVVEKSKSASVARALTQTAAVARANEMEHAAQEVCTSHRFMHRKFRSATPNTHFSAGYGRDDQMAAAGSTLPAILFSQNTQCLCFQCKEMGMRLENKVPPVHDLHLSPTRRAPRHHLMHRANRRQSYGTSNRD